MLVEQVGGDELDPVEQVLDPLVAWWLVRRTMPTTSYPFAEEQLGQVRAVLAGDAGDERGGIVGGVVSWGPRS